MKKESRVSTFLSTQVLLVTIFFANFQEQYKLDEVTARKECFFLEFVPSRLTRVVFFFSEKRIIYDKKNLRKWEVFLSGIGFYDEMMLVIKQSLP